MGLSINSASDIRKLLILNGSHSELPLIKAAKNLGFYVITTGNKPELMGHQYADEYEYGDFSNPEQMLAIAKKFNIQAVCASANDFGAISAAYVAQKMGLPGHDGYDTTLVLHHKHKFKQLSEKLNLKTPRAKSFDHLEQALAAQNSFRFPVMVKPVDLTGGKGVSKVSNRQEYCEAVKDAFEISRQKYIVVEDFFEGSLHSFSCFIVNGKVHSYFSDNEYSFLNPYLVSSSAAPATNVERFAEGLVAEAEKVAKALDLVDGVLHSQYLANQTEFRIIEMTRRCSGDLYPYPVSVATGIDWGEWIVKAESGFDCSLLPQVRQQGFCGRHCIMSAHNGVLARVEISDKLLPYIVQKVEWWQPGEEIVDSGTQKLGVLILKFPSLQVMKECYREMNEWVVVHLR